MFAVFGDPEVMRYSTSGTDQSVEATRARIQKLIDHQASFGFSLWVVEDFSTIAILAVGAFLCAAFYFRHRPGPSQKQPTCYAARPKHFRHTDVLVTAP